MILPAALLSAAAIALSLGVAVCADPGAPAARAAPLAAAQGAIDACVERGEKSAAALRLALGRLE